MANNFSWRYIVEKQPISETKGLLQSKASNVSLYSIRSTSHSQELNFLDTTEDFIIKHDKQKELCSCTCNKYYNIFNGLLQNLLWGVEENKCCYFNDAELKIIFHDEHNNPVLQIEQTAFSGYLTMKSNYNVSSPPGCKIGDISRISEFLEKPRYEIIDVHGDPLFALSISSTSSSKVIDVYVTSNSGKVARIQESKGQIIMKIYQVCSPVEKALLLSLVILLDHTRRADYR